MTTQRWPTAWLLTDERIGAEIDAAMQRAAEAGAGILVRHYRSSTAERRGLAERVQSLGAPLGIAGDCALARELGAALVHRPDRTPCDLPFSMAVHDELEAAHAARSGAALVFVSPVYPTRSHPGAPALGIDRAAALARCSGVPAIALGGVIEANAPALLQRGFSGWAGIDCWLRT